ncbi:hypothetical protein FDUTEX481_03445 [Tolypothrix sp. PCC 7601]|nr:hypothetical protein FDUTEX481_03445 [Tolypothrix sp. PCC 7601]
MFVTHQYIPEGTPCPYNLSHSFFKLVSVLHLFHFDRNHLNIEILNS